MGKKWLAFAFMVLMLISATRVQAVVWGTYVNWGLRTALSTSTPYAMVFYEQDDRDNTMTVWTTLAPNSDRFWLAKTEGSNEAEAFIHDKTEYNSNYERYFMGVTDYKFLDPNTAPKSDYYWAWVYWENTQNNVVDESKYLTIFFAQYNTDIDIINLANNVITVTVTVTDVNGDPVPGAEVYMNIDASSLDSILTRPSLDTELKTFIEMAMKDLLKTQIANYNYSKGVYWVTDNAGQVTFKVPKKVYEGVRAVGTTYKFTLTAKYTLENGTQYVTNPAVIDTLNGDAQVSLLFQEDITGATGGGGQEYIYISFYSDDALTRPVYLSNYNISVIKAFSPDGLSSPATHTYELHNYYTLKIPVDTSYPYVVVTLKDNLGNVVFKKGYAMRSGVYEEYLAGAKKLVRIRVYDTSTGTYLNDFVVTMKGSITDYTVNAVNGTVSVAVVPDTYIVDITHKGNIIYSTVLDVYQTVDTTFFVKASYAGVVKFKFVDSSLKPINVQSVIDSFDIRLESGVFSFELPNINTVYSQDPSYTNNVMYYYIMNNEELTVWQNEGFYLKLLDKQTGIEAKKYFLKMDSNPDEFMIILPIVSMPGETEPYVLPPKEEKITDEQRDQMTRQTTTAVFDYLFTKGLLVVIIAVAIAVELGNALGLFVGLSLLLAFTWMGMVPKTFGALASLGFGAGLILMFRGSGGREG